MKHRVKFKAITYRGEVVNKTVKVDGPEFKEYSEVLNINGKEYPFNITVEDQLIDWLDATDKTDIMTQCHKEWNLINEKDVNAQCHIFMHGYHLLGNFHNILYLD